MAYNESGTRSPIFLHGIIPTRSQIHLNQHIIGTRILYLRSTQQETLSQAVKAALEFGGALRGHSRGEANMLCAAAGSPLGV